jgi:spore coat-associated protein N
MKTTSGKILASVALVGTAAAVAGMGTFGTFSSSTTASQAVAAGTVKIALGATASDTLSVPVSGLVPGDPVEKLVTLANTGTSDLGSVALTTTDTAASPSALTTDPANGLQLLVENCSTPWTGAAAPYTCTGTKTTVLVPSSVVGANRALTNLASLTSGKADNLKVTTTLPKSAPDSFQGAASTVGFSFAATQRAETVK